MFHLKAVETNKATSMQGEYAKVVHLDCDDFADREVCVAVAYRPDGVIGPGLRCFMNAFSAENINVVLCLIVEAGAQNPAPESTVDFAAVLMRQNVGYDFGAWAGTLRAMPELWAAKRIYFVNDSIVGPNENFPHLVAAIRNDDSDFIALTAATIDKYHAQSYFFVYGEKALGNDDLRACWLELPDLPSKVDVIQKCEQAQLEKIFELNLKARILYELSDVVSYLPEAKLRRFTPTHHAWRELALRGFPFLKVDLFHRPKWKLTGWSAYFEGGARNSVRQQLRENLASRREGLKRGSRSKKHDKILAILFDYSRGLKSLGKRIIVEIRCARG